MQKSSWHLTTENRVTSSSNAAIRSSHEFNCSTRSSLSAHHPTTSTHVSNHVREKARIRKQDNQNKSNSTSRVFQRMQNAQGTAFSPPFNFHPAFLAYTSSCISYLTRSVSVADLPVASQSALFSNRSRKNKSTRLGIKRALD